MGTLVHGEDDSPSRKWGHKVTKILFIHINFNFVSIKIGWLSITAKSSGRGQATGPKASSSSAAKRKPVTLPPDSKVGSVQWAA